MGYNPMGDLSELPASRESFKERYRKTHLGEKESAVAIRAGQLYRFLHEMKVGDLVVYASQQDHDAHIGRVKGKYRFVQGLAERFPHRRDVEWVATVPRTRFSQGALYELGCALTLFQLRNYAHEYQAVVERGASVTATEPEDETVAPVARAVTANTRDFILRELATKMKGYPLQEFVAHLLEKMGFHARVSQKGTDGGIDIIAHKDELGFEPPVVKVQVKSTEDNVGDPEVSALVGKLAAGEFGLVVTLGGFTPQAKAGARGRANLRLVDGDDLVGLILEHYEEFDARFKGLLPLKRVYVPQPAEEAEA